MAKKRPGSETEVTPAEKKWAEDVAMRGKTEYNEVRRVIHQLRRIRAMRMKARAPKSFQRLMGKGIRAPMSYALVQTLVGIVAKERPVFARVPRNPKDKQAAQRLANSAGPTLQALEKAIKRPLYYLMADQLVGDGRGGVKLRMTPWEGYPIRQPGEEAKKFNRRVENFLASASTQPLRANIVDGLNLLPAREEWDTPYVVETGVRQLRPVLNRLGMEFDAMGHLHKIPEGRAMADLELPAGVSETMAVDEVWTDNEVFITFGGQTIKLPNEFGFIPYVWAFGEITSIPDPTLEGVSSIFPFLGVEPWLNTMLTVIAAWSILGSTPIMYTSRQPSANVPPDTEVALSDIPLGKRIDLGTGGQAGFIEPPGVGREVIEFSNLLLSMYERAGITPLARGIIGTRTPGLTLAAALEAATDKLKPLIWNFEQEVSGLISMIWKTVDTVIKKPIAVSGEGLVAGPFGIGQRRKMARFFIDPKDINGYYDVDAKVKLSSLQDLISQGMHSAFMVGHKLWSRERGMRFSGVDDPFEEFLEVTKDELRQSPIMKEFMLRQALGEEPQLQALADELEAQGLDLLTLAEKGVAGATGGGGGGETTFEGEQPRGGPAPRAGGRSAGTPRRPGGQRGGQGRTPQGGQQLT